MVMFGWWRRKSKLGIARMVIIAFLLAVFIFSFYFWRLGNLTAGLGPTEVNARSSSSSLQLIFDNPIYAPHKISQYAAQRTLGHGALALRSVSAVLAILLLFCFYLLVKEWFGKVISSFATLLLAATPWFVLLARSGGPEISLLAPIVALAMYYRLIRLKSRLAWLVLVLSAGLVLYLPGGLLLILLGTMLVRANLRQAAKDLGLDGKILVTLIMLIILTPLIYAGARSPSSLKPLLLIPTDWPSIAVAMKSTARDVLALFWRTPLHVDYIIGRLPMFNGAQTVLALFGGFAFLKLARTKLYLLFGMVIFAVLAAGLNRDLTLLSLAMPAISLSMAAGLRYLYIQWRSVFPKNPLPKYLALTLIAVLVTMHIFYGFRFVLLAWPNSAATRSIYVLK